MIDLLLHNLRTIGTHHCDGTVGEEAADEIERLRAEVAGCAGTAQVAGDNGAAGARQGWRMPAWPHGGLQILQHPRAVALA